jgi:hypothetical protein
MSHHLATAARVVIDAPIDRFKRQTAGGRPRDHRVEPSPFVIDLDDVPDLYPL